jgi:MYXO-CTERM domain-containing protein
VSTAEVYTTLGSQCVLSTDCPSGFCADGVCCDTACSAGDCDACSVAAGAPVGGTCALLTGPICNDDLCTHPGTCSAGQCVGSTPIACPAVDSCHDSGACDPKTGTCPTTPKKNGTSCGATCTQGDTCQEGVCVSGGTVLCEALNECHIAGVCDSSGQCTNPPKPDGLPCKTGICFLGSCSPEPSNAAAATAAASGVTSSGSASGGSTASEGAGTPTGSGGSTANGGPGGAGANGGASENGSGAAGQTSPTSSSAGGCSYGTGEAPQGNAAWLLLGLVFALRRRSVKHLSV